MTIELKMLALAVVLGLVQVILASHAASLERGYLWTASGFTVTNNCTRISGSWRSLSTPDAIQFGLGRSIILTEELGGNASGHKSCSKT